MAYYFVDNIYSTSFTPREPNIELLDASIDRNIVICLGNNSGKSFIASKLLQDAIIKADPKEGTLSMYVSDSSSMVSEQAACFHRLTNITVIKYHTSEEIQANKIKKSAGLDQILVMKTQVAVFLFKENILNMSDVNLIILHDCQWILKDGLIPIKELMSFYYKSAKKPHILGLASSLFSSGSGSDLSLIKANLNKLEDLLDCKAETASNMLSLLRYGTHPYEMIIEYGPYEPSQIDKIIENEIRHALNFLNDHQYNPLEIYEGFKDELQNIPDPIKDPKEILLELLNSLFTFGPWCTDRAALILLSQIEELKVITPYERHYLLLCMTSSVLVKIRAILDDFFKDINQLDRIYKFSSPKILRLIEILRKFIPEKLDSDLNQTAEDERESSNHKDEKSNHTLKLSKSSSSHSISHFSEININKKYHSSSNYSSVDYLVEKLQKSEFKSISENKFLESNEILNHFVNYSSQCLESNSDINNSFYDQNFKENNRNSNINLSENKSAALDIEFKGKTNSILLQMQNGYFSEAKEKIFSLRNSVDSSATDVSFDNYLPFHEYLMFQKFKIEKHASYNRFSLPNHTKSSENQDEYYLKQIKMSGDGDIQLCGLIFVEKKFTARVLFHVLNDLKQFDEEFSFLSVQFTVDKVIDVRKDPKGAEKEHRKQELILKKFRMKTCNLLIGTSFLEEGIDLPKCNLVIRFDTPPNYWSYINTKERARATDSLYCLLVDSVTRDTYINNLAKFYETEAMLLEKCSLIEPSDEEERIADQYTQLIEPFCPLLKQHCPFVDLSTAVALVNRYCAKLPSDTFTRLTPICSIESTNFLGKKMFTCKIRLPINSPVKKEIQGCPMPTKVLAKRFAAFQCCQTLHLSGELDDTLQPISKESFWMREEEQFLANNEELEDILLINSSEPRPGTTKRRQYYYKKIADSLTDCLPLAGKPSFLYAISMALTCPLPEAQNTRGRKIHPPEDSVQGFGILLRKSIPKIGPFPIFTRSGEVQVKLQLAQSTVILTPFQIDMIVAFIHYTFTSVLRLQKYLMMFDPTASENSYFIVPTKKGKDQETVEVDWDFLELIFEKKNQVPTFVPEEDRKNFIFDPVKFEDAVVSPWYRSQDQPEYLYVAEICTSLNPKSSFPGPNYQTFEEYYMKKYNIIIQNKEQALLDVDHTSARLNFLTPRYVNRKGVALPTTSEEKKKAKRENLKQKQILVPELCDIHPFPATLWRKAVCLPCILHRINALLLADEFRRVVAAEIGIGSSDFDRDFNWKPLNFGWSLADVLKQTIIQKEEEEMNKKKEEILSSENLKSKVEDKDICKKKKKLNNFDKVETKEECLENQDWIEMGTWSNDMAGIDSKKNEKFTNLNEIDDLVLSKNITMIEDSHINDINMWESEISPSLSQEYLHYCSPTNSSWPNQSLSEDDDLTDDVSESLSSEDECFNTSEESDMESEYGRLKIEFKDNNMAEALESSNIMNKPNEIENNQPWYYEESEKYSKYVTEFNENLERRKAAILGCKNFFNKDQPFDFVRNCSTTKKKNGCLKEDDLDETILENSFGNADNVFPRPSKRLSKEIKSLPYTDIILKSLSEEEKRIKGLNKEIEKIIPEKEFANHGGPFDELDDICKNFSFDEQPDLEGHPGPSPSLILQALTMSNANDGINLERLETIGDSFLKYAITTYLYCMYENVHEGKLSHLRSKQVSNYNLYRLGRKKDLGERMVATKFEPHDNWLPPCYYVPRELERALIEAGVPANHWNRADLPYLRNLTKEEISQLVREKGEKLGLVFSEKGVPNTAVPCLNLENMPYFIPYNLMTQHSIPDKSIADCVEALIGAYLVACGPRGALLFMSWLGINVLPKTETFFKSEKDPKIQKGIGCTLPTKVTTNEGELYSQICYGSLVSPRKYFPFNNNVKDPEEEIERLLRGFDIFEDSIKYHFRNKSYLLQAFTHASYSTNRLTDCYQRLEFLGDAVLDYLITRHLYEDPRHHSPGALTDLRSALVNNTIFASLAVRHNFHKYFRHLCPILNEVIDRFVRFQHENNYKISEEFYLIGEDECEEGEDVEVPKALGDIFESVAGAIYLDSGMSLDAVWKVYYSMMRNEIELFSTNVPKSPIRELFELEPETAQFGKPEKLADGKRVRVTVEVFGKGLFSGIGRNYRIAKCTAAKCALKELKQKKLLEKKK